MHTEPKEALFDGGQRPLRRLWCGALLASLTAVWPTPAPALEEVCEAYLEEQTPVDTGFREKASRFVPDLHVSAIVRDYRDETSGEVFAAVGVAPPPAPNEGEHNTARRHFFQWQIELQWDVLDMLDRRPKTHKPLSDRPELAECRFEQRREEAPERIEEFDTMQP